MIEEGHKKQAILALKWALVGCRTLAYQKTSHEKLAEVFDALEILPVYLVCEEDMTWVFRQTLVDLQQEHGREFRMALLAFDGILGE